MILILLLEVRRYIYSKVLIISDVSIQLTSFYMWLTSENRGAQWRLTQYGEVLGSIPTGGIVLFP